MNHEDRFNDIYDLIKFMKRLPRTEYMNKNLDKLWQEIVELEIDVRDAS